MRSAVAESPARQVQRDGVRRGGGRAARLAARPYPLFVPSARPPSRQLSATGHIFAVVDDPAAAPAIVHALVEAGVDPADVTMLRGTEGAARIDATGEHTGFRARVRQILSFLMVDQMPDFILYEAAVLDGRTVLAVRATAHSKGTIHDVLRSHGAHFINSYTRFATEELDLWRGPELRIPGVLRR